MCCLEGKVKLQSLAEAPKPLKRLLSDQGQEATTFREKIRIYNSIFSLTSFGARSDEKINEPKGPYTFRISGQNYHRVGSLVPNEGILFRYAQLYFYDTENELKNRLGYINLSSTDVNEAIATQLIDMFDEHSVVAKTFRMARDWSVVNRTNNVTLKLLGERPQRQYDRPQTSEVAALVVGDFGETNASRDILIEHASGGLQRISEIHPLYIALQYPLLFPYGEDGFHPNIPYHDNSGNRKTQRGNVTMKEFYCYRIHQRLNEATTVLEAERLFYQYLVDAYSAVEDKRFGWIRFNQEELRAELYNNICDAVTRGDTDAKTIGMRIVLPATLARSPRYMALNYQDAMAICRSFGNPALIIIFTANPRWPEVKEMLASFPGQRAQHRPDIMVRNINTERINDIISAKISCKSANPEAHRLVVEHMLHGPCGRDNKNSPCMVNGECKKHLSKPFYTSTTLMKMDSLFTDGETMECSPRKGELIWITVMYHIINI
ncbi:LOW QUALITY PROTEIN: hypothetical protein V2J09_011085 [Rumex salicifolius]